MAGVGMGGPGQRHGSQWSYHPIGLGRSLRGQGRRVCPSPWSAWALMRRPGLPRSPAPAHLVQEAHEVAEDGQVVFRKALQDLAAAGHPQAALHACKGMRSPESFRRGGRGCREQGPPVGPGASTNFWPWGRSQQTLPPSCSGQRGSYLPESRPLYKWEVSVRGWLTTAQGPGGQMAYVDQ